MPRFMWHVTYTTEGARGLAKEGGSGRRRQAEELLRNAGGRLEAFYYAFGETDGFIIAEVPDNATAVAISLAVNTAGAAITKTTVLLTPEEIDEAVKKKVGYRAPGK